MERRKLRKIYGLIKENSFVLILALQLPMGQNLLIHEVSRSHMMHHSR
jgi:hypothetical protein